MTAIPEAENANELPITLYTTPGCPGCQMTHRAFEKAGVDIVVVNLADRPDLIEQFKREGLMSAPILEDEAGERTSGFRPDRIRALIAASTGNARHASTASTAGGVEAAPRRATDQARSMIR